MKRYGLRISGILSLFFLLTHSILAQESKMLSVEELLEKSEKVSPEIAARIFRAKEAEKHVGVAEAEYYPTAYFSSMITSGLPGSFGEPGVYVPRGIMVSPFHAGPSAGIWGQWTIADFGRRDADVKIAESQAKTRKEEIKLTRVEILDNSVRTYYTCSRNRSLRDLWSGLSGDLNLIRREVLRFVRNGQRSIVDRYLIEAQVEQIETQKSDYDLRMKKTVEQLSVLIEEDPTTFACPAISDAAVNPIMAELQKPEDFTLTKTGEARDSFEELPSVKEVDIDNSPLVKRAKSALITSQTKLSRVKKDFNPYVKTSASIGTFGKARIVPYQNYAVNLSFVVPLFEGFKTVSQIKAAEQDVSSKMKELEAARRQVTEMNVKLDKTIYSATLRVQHLRNEVRNAETGYELAKNRYLQYQGNLIDFREAYRNLLRTKSELIDASSELLIYSKTKMLINGVM